MQEANRMQVMHNRSHRRCCTLYESRVPSWRFWWPVLLNQASHRHWGLGPRYAWWVKTIASSRCTFITGLRDWELICQSMLRRNSFLSWNRCLAVIVTAILASDARLLFSGCHLTVGSERIVPERGSLAILENWFCTSCTGLGLWIQKRSIPLGLIIICRTTRLSWS